MKAIITSPAHTQLRQALERYGIEVHTQEHITNQELENIIHDYHILVVSTSIKVDESLLAKAQKLKIIGRLGSGLEHIDSAAAQKANIKVLSSPEGNARAVAEHVLAILLNYTRHITSSQAEVKQGLWQRDPNRGQELEGKTIGIVGMGANGSLTAKILHALGLKIHYYDKYKEAINQEYHQCNSLQELIQDIDILSFHVPYNTETHHYLNADIIQKITKPILVINISRGEIIDTQALLEGLDQQKIKAALLDVIEKEQIQVQNHEWKPQDTTQQTLKTHPSVYITPHIAGYTTEAKQKMASILAQRIIEEISKF